MQSLGEIELCLAVGAIFLYATLGLPARGGHSSNKYCVKVYGSILMPFQHFFQKGLLRQVHYVVLIYVVRWRHNFREIAVKNYEKSKKSAEKFVRTTSYR